MVVTYFHCGSVPRMLFIAGLHRSMRKTVGREVKGFLGVELYYDFRKRVLRSVSLWRDLASVYGMGSVYKHVAATRIPGRLSIDTACGVYEYSGDWRDVLFGAKSAQRPPL